MKNANVKSSDVEVAMQEFLNDCSDFDKQIAELKKQKEVAYQKKLKSKYSDAEIKETAMRNKELLSMQSKEIIAIDEEIKELKIRISSLKKTRNEEKKKLSRLGSETKKLLSIAKVKAKTKTSETCLIHADGTMKVFWQKYSFNTEVNLLNKVWYGTLKEELKTIPDFENMDKNDFTYATKNFLHTISSFVRTTFNIKETSDVTQEKIDSYVAENEK